MSSSGPRVVVAIVSYNTRELTLQSVASALAQRGVRVRVSVVDNASTDGSADAIERKFPEVDLHRSSRNLGFGPANNEAVRDAPEPWILFLNSDARLLGPADLATLVARASAEPRVAVVGPRLEGVDGRLQVGARRFPGVWSEWLDRTDAHRLLPRSWKTHWLLGRHFDHRTPVDCDWVTGACMLVRASAFADVGGFPQQIFMYGEELDLCLRLRRAAWRVRFDPIVTVEHEGGGSGAGSWRVRATIANERWSLARDRGAVRAWWLTLARAKSAWVEWVLFAWAAHGVDAEHHGRRSRGARAVAAAATRELLHGARVAGPTHAGIAPPDA